MPRTARTEPVEYPALARSTKKASRCADARGCHYVFKIGRGFSCRHAKGVIHTSPGPRPGTNREPYIGAGQRPASWLKCFRTWELTPRLWRLRDDTFAVCPWG